MPCEAYPWLFPKGTLFDKYPFLLSNLVCVGVVILGISISVLFLEETHADMKTRGDIGLELGRRIVRRILGGRDATNREGKFESFSGGEIDHLTNDKPTASYRSTEGSSRVSTRTPAVMAKDTDLEIGNLAKENRVIAKIFNRQVILVIVDYDILTYHSVSFDSLMPTFLGEPIVDTKPSLPFRFAGGFALSTKTIGFMMAIQGVYSTIAQLWFFPLVIRRMGILFTFRIVRAIWPLLYLAVPYLVLFPTKLQTAGVYVALLTKITFHIIAFPSNAILLTNTAPSKKVLGTINGVAASTACVARAFGPIFTGAIHSFGLKFGFSGPAWWFGGLVCAVRAIESFYMEEAEGHVDLPSTRKSKPHGSS